MAAMSGSLSLGKASQVGIFGRQRHQPGWRTCSCSWWAQTHSSNLPSFQLQRQRKLLENRFPYPSSPVAMGRDAAGEDGHCGYCPIQGMHSTGGERGEFTAVSRCGEAQIAKYLGKKITSVLVSFIPTQLFFLAPIHEPQTEGIWREGALALLRWHLGHVRMSFSLSNQSVIKWGAQGRERGGWQMAEHLAQKLLQQV